MAEAWPALKTCDKPLPGSIPLGTNLYLESDYYVSRFISFELQGQSCQVYCQRAKPKSCTGSEITATTVTHFCRCIPHGVGAACIQHDGRLSQDPPGPCPSLELDGAEGNKKSRVARSFG